MGEQCGAVGLRAGRHPGRVGSAPCLPLHAGTGPILKQSLSQVCVVPVITQQGKQGGKPMTRGLNLLLVSGSAQPVGSEQHTVRYPEMWEKLGSSLRRGCVEFSHLSRTRVLKYEDNSSGKLLTPVGGLHGERCLSGEQGSHRRWNLTSQKQNNNLHRFILGLIRPQRRRQEAGYIRPGANHSLIRASNVLWKPDRGLGTELSLD